jgi:type VI secretion system protein ImpB
VKQDINYQGIKPSAKELPTSTALLLQPMTLDAVGTELESETAEPVRVDNLDHAFKTFTPKVHFKSQGPAEIEAQLSFAKLADFDPKNILKGGTSGRNDLAKLEATISLLYRLKERWAKPSVRKAWSDQAQRQQILGSLASLRTELQSVAGQKKG